MLDIKAVLKEVEGEIAFARKKFPYTNDIVLALMEEVGELSQALLQQKYEHLRQVSDVDVYKEAIQVAAMALRIASEGVPDFPYNIDIIEEYLK